MFDALEQKWKQTEQVGESKTFFSASNNKHKFNRPVWAPPLPLQWKQKAYCGKSEMSH